MCPPSTDRDAITAGLRLRCFFAVDTLKATCSTAAMISAPAWHRFEHEIVDAAKSRGWVAYVVGKQLKYDVIVKGYKVQCKCLGYAERGGKLGVTATVKYRSTDFDVLALQHESELYLIPTWRLESKAKPGWVKCTIYPFDYRKWIDAWHVFDGEKECDMPERQSLLFDC